MFNDTRQIDYISTTTSYTSALSTAGYSEILGSDREEEDGIVGVTPLWQD